MVDSAAKLVLYGGIGVAAIAAGYFVINDFVNASSCSYVGSACSTATSPYIQAYQTCANSYSSELKAYLAQNDAAGTGLTAPQLTNLNYLTSCMNANAQAIVTTAEKTNPNLLGTAGRSYRVLHFRLA